MAKRKGKYAAEGYSYQEYNHSPGGIAAIAIGICSLLVFVILTGICASLQGAGGAWSGSIGVTAFAAAFAGMIIGLKSFRDQCRSYICCKIGTLLCGLMVAVWFLVFCMGLASM